MVKRRVYDEAFKVMAVELSYAKGYIQDAAHELGIDPGRIRKWRQQHQKNDQTQPAPAPIIQFRPMPWAFNGLNLLKVQTGSSSLVVDQVMFIQFGTGSFQQEG